MIPNAPPVISALPPAAAAKLPPRHYESRIHLIFFWSLLAIVLPTTLDIFVNDSTADTVVGVGYLISTVVLAIIALVKQTRDRSRANPEIDSLDCAGHVDPVVYQRGT